VVWKFRHPRQNYGYVRPSVRPSDNRCSAAATHEKYVAVRGTGSYVAYHTVTTVRTGTYGILLEID
jgi:hypothetical protein